MKEVIVVMSVLVEDGDEHDGMAIENAFAEIIEQGWQFSKAQQIVIDRPDVHSDDCILTSTRVRIVPDDEAEPVFSIYNDNPSGFYDFTAEVNSE